MLYIDGKGDKWLELINKCYSMLLPNENLPSIQMVYNHKNKTFNEGFIWDGFWIQNSYGFILGAIPFLNQEWREVLQNSLNLFWDRIGDGKRAGTDKVPCNDKIFNVVAPDGSLGDCVLPQGIVYKQGDGNPDKFDWFYEGASAAIVMQTELFLFERNIEQIKKLLPKLKRSIEFVEKTRDRNNLYLVGASSNLLAPSFGGDYDKDTNTLKKSYLSGLLITQTKALKNMIEICKLIKDDKLEKDYESKFLKNLKALILLLTDEGYFAKSMSVTGEKHGVYGANKFGYFDSVCNVDAVALGIVDRETSEKIYNKISSIESLRPFSAICNNYPHLDDTYINYLKGTSSPDSLGYKSGDWVDGGCWATVEGRAVIAYMKLAKYDDAYNSVNYYMKWAEDYRMDAPLSQWGENSLNPWQIEKKLFGKIKTKRPVSVIIDNFAPSLCLLRGLFGYEVTSDKLLLSLNVPTTINSMEMKMPFYVGDKAIYINYERDADFVKVNGVKIKICNNTIEIPISLLESFDDGTVNINFGNSVDVEKFDIKKYISGLSPNLKSTVKDTTSNIKLENILMILKTELRKNSKFDVENFRPMTKRKKRQIIKLYEQSCINN